MCTVVFFPLDGGGYLLGHNRDESVTRARGAPPRLLREGGISFLAPRDPEGNGSWIGVNAHGLTACILNAAETDPSRLPPSPLSRGLILWDLLSLRSIDAAGAKLVGRRGQLRGVRAFHVVVAIEGGPGRAASGTPAQAGWFRWNGTDLTRGIEEGPALFVSSGYDQEGAERERGRQWRSFLDAPRGEEVIASRVASWLRSHDPVRGARSVCMHRSDAATVSRTIVTVSGETASLSYHDGSPCDDRAAESIHALPLT